MAQVIVRENESLESALKRFKRSCARDGVMSELRKREHYEKPSVKKRLRNTKHIESFLTGRCGESPQLSKNSKERLSEKR